MYCVNPTWHAGVLGMTLNVDEGRITIFRSTLEVLGWPSHYRFLYNPQMNQIAVQVCSATDAGAHRVGKLNEFSSCEIKCVAFVRMVYKNAQWDKRSTAYSKGIFSNRTQVVRCT